MTADAQPVKLDTGHVLTADPEHAGAVAAVLASGNLSGTGPAVVDYEQALTGWFGTAHAVACSSGTGALHMALLAVDVASGDEVIVAATAPTMTGLAVLAAGAVPVFADTAGPDTFALDVDDVQRKLTDRTRAVIAVPMWGYPADGPDLADTCQRWGIPLIEDAAQAHGTTVAGRYAGATATIGAFSTHERKLLTTGEGGFCLTDDPAIASRLRTLRNLGKPPGGGFGATFGLNYKLAAPLAAIGRVQLAQLNGRIRHRRATLRTIHDFAATQPGLDPFPIRPDGVPNGYAALLITDGPAAPLAHRLAAAGIVSDPHRYQYQPLYHTPAFARHTASGPCPNAEELCATVVTLPCHEGVDAAGLDRIMAALHGGTGR